MATPLTPDFTMGEGDSLPIIRTQLKNPDGTPMDLTGCTVTAKMSKIGSSAPAVVLDPDPDPDQIANIGYVDLQVFEAGEAVPGVYQIRFKVVNAASETISVRNYFPHLLLDVTADPA